VSCENKPPAKWCPGPDGPGRKCSVCEKLVAARPPMSNIKITLTPPVEIVNVIRPESLPLKVITYRGDTRCVSDVRGKGFELWIPEFTIVHARHFILLYAGIIPNVMACNFYSMVPKRVDMPSFQLKEMVFKKRPDDLMREIIAQKSKTRPTVSTDLDSTCGGYASGFIYKMCIPGMREVAWAAAIPGLTASAAAWPALYLDKPTLAEAAIIAVLNKSGVRELTFLTPINFDWIMECQPPDQMLRNPDQYRR
jgi:hypothetical protein